MPGPLRCALIGVGTRARKLYLPILAPLAPWIELVAICTPDPAKAEATGRQLGVPSFTSLTALIESGLAEAAIVLSTIESHHAISVTLSRHGIHQLIETTMASTVAQARQMVEEADRGGVTLLVAENYFRFPFDRLAKAVAKSGAIGDVHRVTCFHDQVGFHGHARWINFFDSHPIAVQSNAHRMPTARHVESARRIHESETFRICQLYFDKERIAIDMGGNPKGLIGRSVRPGYTEVDGTRGAIVRQATANLDGRAELRLASDAALARDGKADQIVPFEDVVENATWVASRVSLPDRTIEVTNALRPGAVTGDKIREWDGAVVMEIVVEFAEAVAGRRKAEFTAQDALRTTEIEMACRESARLGGTRLELDADVSDFASEADALAAVRKTFSVDPMDTRAMIEIHFPPAA